MPHSAAAVHIGRELVRPGTADANASAWANVLADVPLFAELNRRHLRKVAGIARIARFEDGSAIVRAGQDGDSFYVLVDGSAKVARRGLPPLTLDVGSFFGEMALLDGGPRAATVSAKGPVACLVITRPRFLKLLRSEPAIAVAMVQELARRLRAAQAVA